MYVFTYHRESAPHSETLECYNDLHPRLSLHPGNEFQVFSKARFVEYKAGGRYFVDLHETVNFRGKSSDCIRFLYSPTKL